MGLSSTHMGTMRFLLLLSLVSLAISDKCAGRKKSEVQCCTTNKPFDCLEKPDEERCLCEAPDIDDGSQYTSGCNWNKFYTKYDKSNAEVIPCSAQGVCPYDPKKTAALCSPRVAETKKVDYPPRSDNTPIGPEGYCKLTNSEEVLIPQTEFYKVFLTCWSYNCEPRLRKPKEMEQQQLVDVEGNNWCYPPLDGPRFKWKYCEKDVVNKKGDDCVLLPLCDSDVYEKEKKRQINPKVFMYPQKVVDGKPTGEVDTELCQLLCPADSNNGIWNDQPCVPRPACGKTDGAAADAGTAEAVAADAVTAEAVAAGSTESTKKLPETTTKEKNLNDPMQTGVQCLPWCSFSKDAPEDDDYKKKDRKNNCINRPVCEKGAIPADYVHPSEYCIEPRQCKTGEKPESHFCTEGEENEPGGAPMQSSGLGSTWTIIIIVVCVFVVAAIGAFVYWFFFFRKRNNDDTTLDTKTAVVDPELAKAEAKVENPTEANLLAKKHRLDHTQNEQQPSVSQANKDKDGVMKKASMPTYYKPESGEEQKDKKESKEKDSKEKSSKIGKEGKEAKSEKKEKSEKKDKV